MSKKAKIIFILASALVTLTVPMYIVFTSEALMEAGAQYEYKFRTAPVDPYDVMRGRYISLNFETSSTVPFVGKETPGRGTTVYVTVKKDITGYAVFDKAYASPPKGSAWFETTADYYNSWEQGNSFGEANTKLPRVSIKVPFDRYYMNEDNAPQAEYVYSMNTSQENRVIIYALVVIKDGRQGIKQIYVNDEPLNTYLEHTRGDYDKEMKRREEENKKPMGNSHY
jgi:uncharacterized membrane-anchored protein